MKVLGKERSRIELLAYVIVLFSFLASLSFPLFFHYVGPFAAPTAVFASQITSSAHVRSFTSDPIFGYYNYWEGSTEIEVGYPVPSLLLATLNILTNIPKELLLFIPLAGIVNIAHFVLAKNVLCDKKKKTGSGLLFASLYYAYVTFTNIQANYVGRATLGIALLTVFLVFYLKFLDNCLNCRRTDYSWITLLILTIIIGWTYYVSTAAIIVVALLMITVIGFANLVLKPLEWEGLVSTNLMLGALATLLFLENPFISSAFGGKSASSLLTLFVDNCIQLAKIMLGIESGQNGVRLLQLGLIKTDAFSSVLGWLPRFLTIAAVISILIVLVAYRHSKHQSIQRPFNKIWLFSVLVVLLSISELSYLFMYPFPNPTRFLSIYGMIPLFFVCERLWVGSGSISVTLRALRFHRFQKIIALFLIGAVVLGSYVSFRSSWYYGIAEPFAYEKVQPLSQFLNEFSSEGLPVSLVGDACFTANIFFITSIGNGTGKVIPNPIGEDAITLAESLATGNMTSFFDKMHERSVNHILIVKTGRPIYGDAWGYAVTLPSTGALQASLNLVYSDEYSQLFEIPARAR